MSYPKNFPSGSQIQVALVAGGDITDPAKDHSCNQRLFSPLEHSDTGVQIKHLPFSPMIHSPTNGSQQTFHGTMDPGSLVYVLKTTGQASGIILGQANDILNMDRRSKGNEDLLGTTAKELFDRTIKINIPPDIQETVERGAKVKKIKEKGREHSHNVLKGLPSHGALHQMSGWKIPQLQNVPTAIQKFSGLQTNDMLANMPGELMSIGGMFRGLAGGFMGGRAGSNGKNPSWVAAGRSDAFATSTEFTENFGIGGSEQPNEEIIRLMYEKVLGREPDAEGLRYWLNQARNGLTAGQIFLAFLESDEFNAGSPNNNEDIATEDPESYLASELFIEDYNIMPTDIATREYITLLYQRLLDREPDQVGLDYWFEKGWDAAAIYMTFLDSSEFKVNKALKQSGISLTQSSFAEEFGVEPNQPPTRSTVQKFYRTILRRDPNENGIEVEYWVQQGVNGISAGNMLKIFTESEEFQSLEYQRKYGGGERFDFIRVTLEQVADESVITEIYQKVLNREPDVEGLNYWVQRKMTFKDILPFFVSSYEFNSMPQSDEEGISLLLEKEREPMDKTPLDNILDSLINVEKLPHLADAMKSLALLTQGSEGGGKYGSYPTNYRVHTETYLANAYELLNNVRSISDIMNVLHRLQTDTELFGLQDLPEYETTFNTPWGPQIRKVDYQGNITTEFKDDKGKENRSKFNRSMTNPQGSPSAGAGSNMFGGQVQNITKMFDRLGPNAQKAAHETVQKNNQASESRDLMKLIRTAVDGGNPISAIQQMIG